ncbi:cell division protein ZipA [Teredinibacter turnerae]|uniref:cell division protein ZipA n=1 Tax=Teredinibacter turnerae TaxID=2426 RepID=UPI0005F84353|nr:cell division protein ZipA [Teredinibacter turnerae]
MRDWLTVIIILLIAGITLDAFRRMRQARRESIRLSKNAALADKEDVRESSSEFPGGGPRVVGYRDEGDAQSITETLKRKHREKKTTVGAPNRIPEQVTLNLDEHVPMLMDPVESPEDEEREPLEPELGDLANLDDSVDSEERPHPPEPEPTPTKKSKRAEKAMPDDDQDAVREPDEVLIINVMAKTGTRFDGQSLLAALMTADMKLGAMDIFHRHLREHGDGPILFSLANMVVPGTFNLSAMADFQTPGVSLFLSLPIPDDTLDDEELDGLSIRAFDTMAGTAKALAAALDGELKDENRSVMTQQTIEHARQRVVEYERKRKLARA